MVQAGSNRGLGCSTQHDTKRAKQSPASVPRPAAEHYVDRNAFAFSRGGRMLVVLTSGSWTAANPRPAAYNLRGLAEHAGSRLCDALHSGVSGGGGWAHARAAAALLPAAGSALAD